MAQTHSEPMRPCCVKISLVKFYGITAASFNSTLTVLRPYKPQNGAATR